MKNHWTGLAACGGVDPSIFDEMNTAPQRARAVAICADCPVKELCLEAALCSPWQPYGVWGGKTANEVKPLWRERHPATSPTERHQEIDRLVGLLPPNPVSVRAVTEIDHTGGWHETAGIWSWPFDNGWRDSA